MNLKYYLRGLGFGIIATALILGFHFSRTSKQMTDDEIKKRAAQLGMVEANQTLVSTEDEMSAEDLLQTIDNDSSGENEETKIENNTPDDSENIATESNTNESGQENESETMDTDSESEDLDAKITELEDTTDDIKTEIEAVTNADDDPDKVDADADTNADTGKTDTGKTDTGKTVTLTIVSGDSSYGVSKKLVELGLVDDASDYDLYLCNNGYDRYIRTGTYTFSTDATNLDIAKAITGK